MSTMKKKPSKKVSQLSQVIAIQERTIQKLQKVLDKERTNDTTNSQRKRQTSEKKSVPSRGNSKPKSKSIANKRTVIASKEANFLATFNQSSQTQIQNPFDTEREKSSISRKRDDTVHDTSHVRSVMRNAFQTNNTDYELQTVKEKLDMVHSMIFKSQIKTEFEAQEKTFNRRQQENVLKMQELEAQNRSKDERIDILNRQLDFSRQQNKHLVTEHARQRATWQELYSDLRDEMSQLKEELQLYSTSLSLPCTRKQQSNDLEISKYEYRNQLEP